MLQENRFGYDARGKTVWATNDGSELDTWCTGLGNLAGSNWKNRHNPEYTIQEFRQDALGNVAWQRSGAAGQREKYFPDTLRYQPGIARLLRTDPMQAAVPQSSFRAQATTLSHDASGNVTWSVRKLVGDLPNNWAGVVHEVRTRNYYGADDRPRYVQVNDVFADGTRNEWLGSWEEFRYDALGRRVMVRSRRENLCASPNRPCVNHVTRFVWSGDEVLWELRADPGNSPGGLELPSTPGLMHGRVSYTLGGGIDRPLAIHKEGNPSIVTHQDWRGQFALGTYTSGARSDCPSGTTTGCTKILWPGGRTTAWHHDQKDPDIHSWFGGQVDGMRDASGQMYMRNRYYDPATGQFTQPDPIGLAGGLNSYGFAAGDPVTYSDPYGLFPCLITLSGQKRCYSGYWTARALGVNRAEARWIQRNPRAAWVVDQISTQTLREVANLAFAGEIEGGAAGLEDGPADAVRHATWSCRLTQRFDENTAQEIGDNHEQNDSPANVRRMDMRNNAVGRRIASSGGDCLQGAMEALRKGDLYTSPDQ